MSMSDTFCQLLHLCMTICCSQTIDPTTRYVGITRAYAKLVPSKVTNLYNTHDDQPLYKGSQHSHMPLAKPAKTSSQKAAQRDVTIQDDMAPAMLRSKSGYYMDLMEKHKSVPDLKEKHKSAPDLSRMPRLDYLKAVRNPTLLQALGDFVTCICMVCRERKRQRNV